jgi:hypothetical protein
MAWTTYIPITSPTSNIIIGSNNRVDMR